MNDLITKIPVGPTLNEKRKVRREIIIPKGLFVVRMCSSDEC